MIQFLRILLIAFYAFAGSYHFINPKFYYPLIPDYLVYPEIINSVSGIMEIVFAIGVAIPKTRKLAVIGIILMLIAFIPSHVYFIQIGGCINNGLCVPMWLAWLRLLVIHPLLIVWAWKVKAS